MSILKFFNSYREVIAPHFYPKQKNGNFFSPRTKDRDSKKEVAYEIVRYHYGHKLFVEQDSDLEDKDIYL
tara:strand:+ start:130 stop:339 length:210 start_codon:yes stop_codon:yes gene_type:complete